MKSQHLTRAKKRNCLWKIEHSKVTILVSVTHKSQKLNWYENKTYTCCMHLIYGCRAYMSGTNKNILTIKISNTTQKLELITTDDICIWNWTEMLIYINIIHLTRRQIAICKFKQSAVIKHHNYIKTKLKIIPWILLSNRKQWKTEVIT